jgi:hypothetical protein
MATLRRICNECHHRGETVTTKLIDTLGVRSGHEIVKSMTVNRSAQVRSINVRAQTPATIRNLHTARSMRGLYFTILFDKCTLVHWLCVARTRTPCTATVYIPNLHEQLRVCTPDGPSWWVLCAQAAPVINSEYWPDAQCVCMLARALAHSANYATNRRQIESSSSFIPPQVCACCAVIVLSRFGQRMRAALSCTYIWLIVLHERASVRAHTHSRMRGLGNRASMSQHVVNA